MTFTISEVANRDQRPGFYANFLGTASLSIRGGLQGILGTTVRAAWGPQEAVQVIKTIADIDNLYSVDESATFNAQFTLREMLKGGASEIRAYRLVGPAGSVATDALDDTGATPVITINGKYFGARGNTFTVEVITNAQDALRKDVILREGTTLLRTYTTRLDNAATGMIQDLVNQINDDTANFWITAVFITAGVETLANVAATNLASGTDDESNIVAADYTEAMDALELENIDTVYFETIDATIVGTNIPVWLLGVRNAGKKIIWVTGSDVADSVANAKTDAEAFNFEGTVYVHPGIKLDNLAGVETTYGGFQAAARVAGMVAGTPLTESLTFKSIPNINDLEVRLGNTDIKNLLLSGIVVLQWDGIRFKIERGINTLSTPGATQSDVFSKIRLIKILDSIFNSISAAVDASVIGIINNDDDGQTVVLTLIREFLQTLEDDNIINPGFTAETDPDNPPTIDRYFVKIGVQPIDSIEFIYSTIEVS